VVVSIVGLALVVFGMVASPLFYLGWACLGAGLISLAASIVALRRERT
jgi:peptidoglycan biosynthesis protein MviN/MurJ (putative lipid II flippase)